MEHAHPKLGKHPSAVSNFLTPGADSKKSPMKIFYTKYYIDTNTPVALEKNLNVQLHGR